MIDSYVSYACFIFPFLSFLHTSIKFWSTYFAPATNQDTLQPRWRGIYILIARPTHRSPASPVERQ